MSWSKSIRMSSKKVCSYTCSKKEFSINVTFKLLICDNILAEAAPANPPPITKIFFYHLNSLTISLIILFLLTPCRSSISVCFS